MENDFKTNEKISFYRKKQNVRKKLAQKGILHKEGVNSYDGYTYFTESQYKELFTELFSEAGLDFETSILEVYELPGIDNQKVGRRIKMSVVLTDVDTGFYDEKIIFGEALDRGDKALNKAYTSAVKYYLANNWLVATGDDPEKDNSMRKQNQNSQKRNDEQKSKQNDKKITERQKTVVMQLYSEAELTQLLQGKGYRSIDDITLKEASSMIDFKRGTRA